MKLVKDWEFNVLNIYNYNKFGGLHYYFEFIRQNHNKIDGDIVEAGVYRGSSLLSIGLFLKSIGSNKQVYGFDSFEGLSNVFQPEDQLERFDDLYRQGRISSSHYEDIKKNIAYRSFEIDDVLTVSTISSSLDFSNTDLQTLQDKIEFLELDNVHICRGYFSDTLVESRESPRKIMAALIDCDVYQGYKSSLPFIWSRLEECGYIFLDEYYSLKFPGARIATDEFSKTRNIKPIKHHVIEGDFERWYIQKPRHP